MKKINSIKMSLFAADNEPDPFGDGDDLFAEKPRRKSTNDHIEDIFATGSTPSNASTGGESARNR